MKNNEPQEKTAEVSINTLVKAFEEWHCLFEDQRGLVLSDVEKERISTLAKSQALYLFDVLCSK